MKTVGIIGGFGPETTAAFQLTIVELFRAQNQDTRPPMLIWNSPIPTKIEDELVLQGKGLPHFLPFLLEAARKLERAGADFLVLPCNTLHLHFEKIRKQIHIPMLHIVEETAKELQRQKINKIAVLANQTSVKNKLHLNIFDKFKIDTILPNKNQQRIINRIIHQILLNQHTNTASFQLRKIILNFKRQKINDILLGCTDLQLILPTVTGIHIHDSMHILAEATVREIIGSIQEKLC